jgi:CheY-like chemotaxis protein
MRILIVEDNSIIRQLLREFLRDVAEVFECADGDEVLAAFTLLRPDWVVMDVQMKRVGGIAATQLLTNAFPDARVVMLSKHCDEYIKLAAKAAGATEYLVKDDLAVLRAFLLDSCPRDRSVELPLDDLNFVAETP